MANRLEILKSMVVQNPGDSFARYGLATEYANNGELQQAVSEFETLLHANPNYAAAYYHCGRALEKLGKADAAKSIYKTGIEVTTRAGDLHTRSELQAALDSLS